MKILQKTVAASLALTALLAMTGCSSSDDGGGSGDSGGSGGSALATGTFVKIVGGSGDSQNVGLFSTATRKYMMLYKSSEIEGSGEIKSISFESKGSTSSDTSCPNVVLKMGHTSLSELVGTFADNIEEGKGSLKTVASIANLTIPAGLVAGDYFSIPLDIPFSYNGKDNLVIEVDRPEECTAAVVVNASSSVEKGYMYDVDVNATTGSLSSYKIHFNVEFSGGVNTQNVEGVTGNTFPFSTLLKRTQHLYTSSDINGSGPITGIAFQLKNLSVAAEYNATVILGHTTLEQFDANNKYADNYKDTPTIVSDNVHFSIPDGLEANDWFWVPLSGSFNYNGTDNLIVDVKVTAASETNQVLSGNSTGSDIRAYGDVENDIPAGADTGIYHMKFRFNGAPIDVLASTTNTGQGFPFWNEEGAIQEQYNAYQLGSAGKITRIECRVDKDTIAETGYSYVITLAQTTAMDLTGVFADNLVLNSVEVFNSTFDTPALLAGDWVGFDLTTPYNYDGVSNLVMEIRGTGGTNGGLSCRRGQTPNAQLLWGGLDAGATSGSTENNLIDTRFYITR